MPPRAPCGCCSAKSIGEKSAFMVAGFPRDGITDTRLRRGLRNSYMMDGNLAESEDVAMRSLRYTRDQFSELLTQTEDYVRENPGQSMLYAFGVGFLFNRLPICRVLTGIAHLALVALKPAVLVYGATKLYQATQGDER